MNTSSEAGNHMQSWAWIWVLLSPEVQGGREEDRWVLPVTVLAEKDWLKRGVIEQHIRPLLWPLHMRTRMHTILKCNL